MQWLVDGDSELVFLEWLFLCVINSLVCWECHAPMILLSALVWENNCSFMYLCYVNCSHHC